MITYRELISEAARYLEQHRRCPKHHVEHTGSNCYLLDFYSELGEIEQGKALIDYLFSLARDTEGGKVFYPGHLNAMNMSQNVIDTGAAVDSIARFLDTNRAAFSDAQHGEYKEKLREVVEPYLVSAASEKYITNQRLWGLTGLASYAKYAQVHTYDDVVRASIERAFSDMTEDGFFLYMPHATEHGNFDGYDGITEFYQSRCSAFIRYALMCTGIDGAPYEERLAKSERALLSMYRADGIKDLRLECKRWYWQSSYEVAGSGFDTYAIAQAKDPAARAALHNALYQVRRHFKNGYLRSHVGYAINFQCPIFWTAHLAWLIRAGVSKEFDVADALVPFTFRFEGTEVFSDTNPTRRILVNARWQPHNFNEGTIDNGLTSRSSWRLSIPALPPHFLFSVRETLNHTWYALRGGYTLEAVTRKWRFWRECVIMLLPRFDVRFGRIESFTTEPGRLRVKVRPATKYGTLAPNADVVTITV